MTIYLATYFAVRIELNWRKKTPKEREICEIDLSARVSSAVEGAIFKTIESKLTFVVVRIKQMHLL